MVSIQSSYTLSKCKCSTPFGNLMSCSLLNFWFCSLNYFSCGDVIYGTFCFSSLSCPFCGDVIWGTSIVYMVTCTTISTTCTTINIAYGSTLPLIIFCALTYVVFCSFFIEPKTPLSSTLFFILKALLVEFATTFFLFFSVVCIT